MPSWRLLQKYEEAGDDARTSRVAHLKRTTAEELAERLQRGEFIPVGDVAAFLKANPPDGWPSDLTAHVDGLLDGTIRQSRGRRPKPGKAIVDAQMSLIYSAMMHWLDGERDLPEEVENGGARLGHGSAAMLAVRAA